MSTITDKLHQTIMNLGPSASRLPIHGHPDRLPFLEGHKDARHAAAEAALQAGRDLEDEIRSRDARIRDLEAQLATMTGVLKVAKTAMKEQNALSEQLKVVLEALAAGDTAPLQRLRQQLQGST